LAWPLAHPKSKGDWERLQGEGEVVPEPVRELGVQPLE
jgi:hypothetical protein